MDGKISAKTCSHCEKKNDSEVIEGFSEIIRFMFAEVSGNSRRTASQISDTHGTGVGIAVHLPESSVPAWHRQRIPVIVASISSSLGTKADNKKKKDFQEKNTLPPVKFLCSNGIFPGSFPPPRHLMAKDSNGKQIPQSVHPLSCHEMLAHKHDVSGLCIGKYFISDIIGISILKTAGQVPEMRCYEKLLTSAVHFHHQKDESGS